MAYQVSGQAPAPGSEGRRLKEVERAIAQLQRLMTAKQKIPKVAAGASPMTAAYLNAPETTVSANTALFLAWNVEDTNLPYSGTGTATTPAMDVLTDGQYFGPAEEGFYGLSVNVTMDFGETPAAGPEVLLNQTANGSARLAPWTKWRKEEQSQFLDLYYDLGPFFYAPDALTHPAFSVAVRVVGGFGVTPSGSVNAWITRLG